MLTASLPRASPLAVYRTPTRGDALISPFLLDPTSITPLTKPSPQRYRAVWLHMPVMVRLVTTREEALRHVHYLSRLRHPNLEQFLGAVIDDRYQKAVITEYVNGRSLDQFLGTPSLTPHKALAIALDVARALVYLHATTGRAHAGVRAESVLVDHARCRAVVLLSTEVRSGVCEAPEIARGSGSVGTPADVYSLAALIMQMFMSIRGCSGCLQPAFVRLLPDRLQGVVWAALQHDPAMRPSIEDLCQALTDCHTSWS